MELVVRSYRSNIAWDTRQMYLKNELRKNVDRNISEEQPDNGSLCL